MQANQLALRIGWAIQLDPVLDAIVMCDRHADGFRGPMAFCWTPWRITA